LNKAPPSGKITLKQQQEATESQLTIYGLKAQETLFKMKYQTCESHIWKGFKNRYLSCTFCPQQIFPTIVWTGIHSSITKCDQETLDSWLDSIFKDLSNKITISEIAHE
jgi:hypothetical protein